MPIGSTFVYNPGDLILQNVSSSGNTFIEVKIAAATSSIILFNSNASLTSQSLNSTTVGTSSYFSGSSAVIGILSASHINVSGSLTADSLSVIHNLIVTTMTASTLLANNGPLVLTGSNAYLQMFPVGGSPIPTSTTASYIYVSGSTNDLYFTQYNGPYTNTTRFRWLESNMYTGILHGGIISSTLGSTTFNVADGEGMIVSMNAFTSSAPYPTINRINWNSSSNALLYSGSAKVTYVGIDSAGQVIQQTNSWGSTDINQWDNSIFLGVVLHLSGSVSNGVFVSPQICYGSSQKTDDFIRAFGPVKISGHTLQASGSGLSIKKTGGTAYREGSNYNINPNHPSVVVDNAVLTSKIFRYYVSGSTTVIDSGPGNAGYSTLDITHYNNNGVLTALNGSGNKQFTLQRVYWFPNSPSNAFIVYYGNAVYGTLLDATVAISTEPFVEAPNTAENAIQLATIIIEGNSTNLTTANKSTIIQAGLFRSVTGTGAGGTSPVVTSLNSLNDVAITTPLQGDLFVYGNGTQWNNTKTLIGNYTVSGSFVTNDGITSVTITSSNISVSGTITANAITASNLYGTSSWSTNSLTASYLTPANSYQITNLTASGVGTFTGLGVGTTSPNTKLEVSGTFRAGNSTDTYMTYDSSADNLNFRKGSYNLTIGFDDANGFTPTIVSTGGPNSLITPPLYAKVSASAALVRALKIENPNSTINSSAVGFNFRAGGNVEKGLIAFQQRTIWGVGDMVFAMNNAGDNTTPTLSDAKMVIQGSTGNIGIGTTTPVNTLDVVGNISCSAITASLLLGTSSYTNTSSVSINALTASYLTPANSYQITNLTASNGILIGGYSNYGYGTTPSIAMIAGTTSSNSQYSVTLNNNSNGTIAINSQGASGILKTVAGSSVYVGATGGANNTYLGFSGSSGGGGTYLNFSQNGARSGLHVTYDFGVDLFSVHTNGNVGINVATASNIAAKLHISGSTVNETEFLIQNISGSNLVFVSSSGNVGIGTNNPTQLLDVNGFVQSSQGFYVIDNGTFLTANAIQLGNSAGRIGLSSTNLSYGTAGTTTSHNFLISGVSQLYISSSGNVGIGTTVPVNKLDVAGNISCSVITASTFFGTSSWSNNSLTSSYITASNVIGTVTSASYALSSSYSPTTITASWATNSLTASYLTTTNNYQITNLTAASISASGGLTASAIVVGTSSLTSGYVFETTNGNIKLGTSRASQNQIDVYGNLNFKNSGGGVTTDMYITNEGGLNRAIKVPGNGGNGDWIIYNTVGTGLTLSDPSGAGSGSLSLNPQQITLTRTSVAGGGGGNFIRWSVKGPNAGGGVGYYAFGNPNAEIGTVGGSHTYIIAANGGTVSGTNAGGNVYIDPGSGSGGGANGKILLGTNTSSLVGIGVANPINTLDVAGNISCSVITASNFTGGSFTSTNISSSGTIIYKNAVLLDYSSSALATSQSNYVILQNLTGSYNSAFFDYFASSASNFRAGTVIAGWSGGNVTYAEYATTDVGNTTQVTMSVVISASYIQLLGNASSSLNWNIKSAGRYL